MRDLEDDYHYAIVTQHGFSDKALRHVQNLFVSGYHIQASRTTDHECVMGRSLKAWDPVSRRPQRLEFVSIDLAGNTRKWVEGLLQNGEMLR